MAKYAKNAQDGGYYLTQPGDTGYHTHGKAYMDVLGWGLHTQGYSFDITKQAWMPPAHLAPGAQGDPGQYGGGTGGGVNTTGGGVAAAAPAPLWPWIAAGGAALALVYLLAKKKKKR